MANDYTNEMFKDTVNKFIKDKIEEGASKEKVEEFIESGAITTMYQEVVKIIADSALKTIEEIMYEKVFEERAYTNEFLARMEQKWGKAFVASEALYICVMESSEEYIKFVAEQTKKQKDDRIPIYNALIQIHARACQEYLEILCLCKNGFADGAYARWRSLYELSIISDFIRKNGKEIAISFLKAADTEDRYEWARCAKCFKNFPKDKYITFSLIQKQCDRSTTEWRKQYNLSNQLVHASPQGTIYRLGAKTDITILSAGHSDYGVTMPMVQSAITLVCITADLFTIYQHGDSLASMMAFHKWISKIKNYYNEVEKNCFSDDVEPIIE